MCHRSAELAGLNLQHCCGLPLASKRRAATTTGQVGAEASESGAQRSRKTRGKAKERRGKEEAQANETNLESGAQQVAAGGATRARVVSSTSPRRSSSGHKLQATRGESKPEAGASAEEQRRRRNVESTGGSAAGSMEAQQG
jgi:hypothetical protein